MPGKRARRHFSQLSEFERGKLQVGRRVVLLASWIVRSVPLEIVRSGRHEKVPTRGKPRLESGDRAGHSIRSKRVLRQQHCHYHPQLVLPMVYGAGAYG
ncbi:hypothetical protein TNCV_4713471 [Trichonephila clavipes]|nr:hypothetical protein TNCV_4713471 [Trichonephila clavipes]